MTAKIASAPAEAIAATSTQPEKPAKPREIVRWSFDFHDSHCWVDTDMIVQTLGVEGMAAGDWTAETLEGLDMYDVRLALTTARDNLALTLDDLDANGDGAELSSEQLSERICDVLDNLCGQECDCAQFQYEAAKEMFAADLTAWLSPDEFDDVVFIIGDPTDGENIDPSWAASLDVSEIGHNSSVRQWNCVELVLNEDGTGELNYSEHGTTSVPLHRLDGARGRLFTEWMTCVSYYDETPYEAVVALRQPLAELTYQIARREWDMKPYLTEDDIGQLTYDDTTGCEPTLLALRRLGVDAFDPGLLAAMAELVPSWAEDLLTLIQTVRFAGLPALAPPSEMSPADAAA